MGCHTWFFRPIRENEDADEIASATCDYSDEIYGDDRYTDIDLPHDVFRIAGFPNNYLLSLEETLAFIEKNKEIITLGENWEERLRAFWSEYPDGVIEFG